MPCKRESRIVGTEIFFTILILMKNTGECNASPLRHTAMPSLFRCQLPYTQAICASCLRKLLSCLHLSSDFSFPLLYSLHSDSNRNNDNPLLSLGEEKQGLQRHCRPDVIIAKLVLICFGLRKRMAKEAKLVGDNCSQLFTAANGSKNVRILT